MYEIKLALGVVVTFVYVAVFSIPVGVCGGEGDNHASRGLFHKFNGGGE